MPFLGQQGQTPPSTHPEVRAIGAGASHGGVRGSCVSPRKAADAVKWFRLRPSLSSATDKAHKNAMFSARDLAGLDGLNTGDTDDAVPGEESLETAPPPPLAARHGSARRTAPAAGNAADAVPEQEDMSAAAPTPAPSPTALTDSPPLTVPSRAAGAGPEREEDPPTAAQTPSPAALTGSPPLTVPAEIAGTVREGSLPSRAAGAGPKREEDPPTAAPTPAPAALTGSPPLTVPAEIAGTVRGGQGVEGGCKEILSEPM